MHWLFYLVLFYFAVFFFVVSYYGKNHCFSLSIVIVVISNDMEVPFLKCTYILFLLETQKIQVSNTYIMYIYL